MLAVTAHSFTLLDGGMGKALQAQGAPFRQPEWSALALMEDPPSVEAAHRGFIDAGADVVITNNYAVVPFHLGRDRFGALATELCALSARLARAAGEATVAGSLPPLYGSYEPDLFDPTRAPSDLQRIADALAPNIDLFLCETQSSLDEALHSIRAAQTYEHPVWVSYTLLEDTVEGTARLRSGERVTDAAALAADHGAEAVLFNCSRPEVMGVAIDEASAALDGSIEVGAYANSFLDKEEGYAANEVILGHRPDLDPAGYLQFVENWLERGATIVGGCCGIMAEHIAAIDALR